MKTLLCGAAIIEYKNHLGDQSWTPIATVVGDGQDQQIVDAHPFPQDMRFYRVRLVLP